VVLKPRPLKVVANAMIRAVLPRTVRYGPVRVVLNPKDPVVSGALAFRAYERSELAFVGKSLGRGMTVLDVGANVGLYSVLSGEAVGSSGRVVALEPDPDSFFYLQESIRENGLENVHAVNLAASDQKGVSRLYTSSGNRGDSRLYNNELSDGNIEIHTVRLDDYLPTVGVNELDFVKIDVQGFEGHVLAGLEQTIRRSPRLVMMSEFWPDGLRTAGTSPYELLAQLERWGLKLYELQSGGDTRLLTDKDSFIARWRGRQYTNVVCRKQNDSAAGYHQVGT
jgi:FkbM family methyltransferase